jgi:hypothetical protein
MRLSGPALREAGVNGLKAEQRLAIRRQHVAPLVTELEDWIATCSSRTQPARRPGRDVARSWCSWHVAHWRQVLGKARETEHGMPFMRDLNTRALAYLKTSPQWWRDVLAARYRSTSGEERPLLIAVRDGYLSIYADGQAVLEAHFDARSGRAQMRGKIHRKYVLGPDAGDGYLVFDGATVSTGPPHHG